MNKLLIVKIAPLQQYNMCLSKYKYLSNCIQFVYIVYIPKSLCVYTHDITCTYYGVINIVDWYIYTI